MASRALPVAAALTLAIAAAGSVSAEDAPPTAPSVRPHAVLDVGPSGPCAAAVVRRVEALVASLRETSNPRAGLTGWQGGGTYFEPAEAGKGTTAKATDSAESAFHELVALGPTAMPALLAHLDDPTPTKLVVEHDFGFGAMWLSVEVGVNRALDDEAHAVCAALGLPTLPDPDALSDDDTTRTITRHAVTVGDVCFALLGQITNRPYEAVRGQPTACIVVNSPTRDPRIARAVRAQWEGKDLRRALARRLGEDLWTTDGERLATGALVRLMAWFPDTVEDSVVRLLDAVDAPDGAAAATLNPGGIDPTELASRAGTIDRPAVHAALVRLAGRAKGAEVVRAALERLPDLKDVALHDHILSVVDDATQRFGTTFDVQALLYEVAARWPDRYAVALRRMLKGHGIEGARVVARIAHEKGAPLPLDAWRFLLDVRDKATDWESHPPGPLERLRVCDVAASQVARLRPDLPFDEAADVPERERRIQAMKVAIDAARTAPEGGGR